MRLNGKSVLCVGDVMLDRFMHGAVSRVSPEAPVPVIQMRKVVAMPGGVANVARNVGALGGRAVLVSAAGADGERRELEALLKEAHGVEFAILAVEGRNTTLKMRLVGNHQQIARVDVEDLHAFDETVERELINTVESNLGRSDAVLLSDYRKGVLSESVTARCIELARAARKPVLIDPKGVDFRRYRRATCLTPNLAELSAAVGRSVTTHEQIVDAARSLVGMLELDAMLVTMSERGMVLVQADGRVHDVPAFAKDVVDVSGAGDTVIATLALASASGLPLETGMSMANAAAAVVVGKAGTSVCTIAELDRQLRADRGAEEQKIIGRLSDLRARVELWRQEGLTIGFTNGCFDIVHAGHIKLLKEARRQCDRLVVGVNGDDSVRRLKGIQRPINTSTDRCTVLEAMECVDAVTTFDEDTPLDLIRHLRPDVLVKGGDYALDTIVGADLVQAAGGKVVIVDLLPDVSTTRIWNRAKPQLAVAE